MPLPSVPVNVTQTSSQSRDMVKEISNIANWFKKAEKEAMLKDVMEKLDF